MGGKHPVVTLAPVAGRFAICRLDANAAIPEWALAAEFVAITRTPAELSIVCTSSAVPRGTVCVSGWRCLGVEGPLDFSLTGVLASLVGPLAQANISVFALSTYDTDYLLLREEPFIRACALLVAAGHNIRWPDSG